MGRPPLETVTGAVKLTKAAKKEQWDLAIGIKAILEGGSPAFLPRVISTLAVFELPAVNPQPAQAPQAPELTMADLEEPSMCGPIQAWEEFMENGEDWKKLGEGASAEVFSGKFGKETHVFKIVPFNADAPGAKKGKAKRAALPAVKEVAPEVAISKAVAELNSLDEDHSCPSFVSLEKATIVRGKYPDVLLNAWRAFKEVNKENKDVINDEPKVADNQLYLVFDLPHAGRDLEKWLKDWREILNETGVERKREFELQKISVFLQVALALAVGEERLQMEHRDLHLSNVMVSDYGSVFFVDLEKSRQSLFGNGPVDQHGPYEHGHVYDEMRAKKRGTWCDFNPVTNVCWLKYLASELFWDCADGDFTNVRAALYDPLARDAHSRIKAYLKEPIVKNILGKFIGAGNA
ncbi:haspin like kinase domain-containing protein [Ditylenchus destructor]|nr:haspin like kinase domain-containing protein [Ditylenchus destructor]